MADISRRLHAVSDSRGRIVSIFVGAVLLPSIALSVMSFNAVPKQAENLKLSLLRQAEQLLYYVEEDLEQATRRRALEAARAIPVDVLLEGRPQTVREVMDRPGRPALMDLWTWSVATAATAVLTDQMPPPSIQELLPDVSPASLFLIYGEQGQPQEIAMNPEFFDAAAEPKQIWEVPEASDIDGLDTQPEEYERRVVDFFDAALLDEG